MFSKKMIMDLDNLNFPPIKLSGKTELILYLIKVEIKNRKLLNGLNDLGFDTTPYTIDFSQIVLSIIGFEKLSEEMLNFYNELMDRYIENVDIWNFGEELNDVTFSIYSDLLMRKRESDNDE
jgi:hypothetical protein